MNFWLQKAWHCAVGVSALCCETHCVSPCDPTAVDTLTPDGSVTVPFDASWFCVDVDESPAVRLCSRDTFALIREEPARRPPSNPRAGASACPSRVQPSPWFWRASRARRWWAGRIRRVTSWACSVAARVVRQRRCDSARRRTCAGVRAHGAEIIDMRSPAARAAATEIYRLKIAGRAADHSRFSRDTNSSGPDQHLADALAHRERRGPAGALVPPPLVPRDEVVAHADHPHACARHAHLVARVRLGGVEQLAPDAQTLLVGVDAEEPNLSLVMRQPLHVDGAERRRLALREQDDLVGVAILDAARDERADVVGGRPDSGQRWRSPVHALVSSACLPRYAQFATVAAAAASAGSAATMRCAPVTATSWIPL